MSLHSIGYLFREGLKSLWKMPKICFCILNVLTL